MVVYLISTRIKGIAYSIAANQIVQLANQGLEIVGRFFSS